MTKSGSPPSTLTTLDDLEDESKASSITVLVQILQMEPVGFDGESRTWEWTHGYVRLGSSAAPTVAINQRKRLTSEDFLLRVPGEMFHPLAPTVVRSHLPRHAASTPHDDDVPVTWSLPETQLQDIMQIPT